MRTTWLAYFPSPPRGVWYLGPLPIRAYALFIIIGIVVALLIGDRRWVARGGERGVIYDIAMWAVPAGLLGGRLYHLATDWRTYWGPGGAGFLAALRIWDGGLGIWGAIALGGVGAWYACRRRGIPLPAFGDALAPGLVLAQAIGRLGNYFNQELYGRETTLPWGLEIFYRRDPSGYVDPHSLDGVSTGQVAFVVQPTFLYELIWNVLVFIALIYLDRRFTIGHGRLFATYVALYCVGRFCVELLRDDAATHIAGIRINSFTSTFVFIGAVVYIILAPKGREDPETLRGAEHVAPEPKPAPEPATVAAASAATAAASVAGAADSTEALESGRESGLESGEADAEVGEPEAGEPEAEAAVVEAGDEPDVVEAAVEAPQTEAEAAPAGEAEVVEQEAEEPEVAGPHVVEAAVEAPQTEAEAEPAGEEVAEPESVAPEAVEPEAVEPEAVEPEVLEPESVEPEAEQPEAQSQTAEPDVQAEETEVTGAEADSATEPEAEEPAQSDGEVKVDEVAEPALTSDADTESEESVAEKAAAELPAYDGDMATRRRWSFRLRRVR